MYDHWLIRSVERRAWLLMGVTIVAALLLPLGVGDGETMAQPGASVSLPRTVISWIAGGSLALCITLMLLVVTAEGRRLKALREGFRWRHEVELSGGEDLDAAPREQRS